MPKVRPCVNGVVLTRCVTHEDPAILKQNFVNTQQDLSLHMLGRLKHLKQNPPACAPDVADYELAKIAYLFSCECGRGNTSGAAVQARHMRRRFVGIRSMAMLETTSQSDRAGYQSLLEVYKDWMTLSQKTLTMLASF